MIHCSNVTVMPFEGELNCALKFSKKCPSVIRNAKNNTTFSAILALDS
jgi:hypothetical protein